MRVSQEEDKHNYLKILLLYSYSTRKLIQLLKGNCSSVTLHGLYFQGLSQQSMG